MWDHMVESHTGKEREEPHENFEFFLTGSFTKPLERQIDEARRIERAESEGKATIMVRGRRKEIRVRKELLNRKDERYNLGRGSVRANFGPSSSQSKAPPKPSFSA